MLGPSEFKQMGMDDIERGLEGDDPCVQKVFAMALDGLSDEELEEIGRDADAVAIVNMSGRETVVFSCSSPFLEKKYGKRAARIDADDND